MSRISGLAWLLIAAIGITATANAQDATQLESLKTQADSAYRQRDFPTTIDLADRVLKLSATDHTALYLRGSGRIEMGIASGQMELVRKGIADAREAIRHEGNGKADYYLPYIYGMSHLALMEGKVTHAKTAKTVADSVLERNDITDEQRANLLYQRAQAVVRLKEYTNAEADLNQAIKLNPKLMSAYMLKAEILSVAKTPADAIVAYTDAIKQFPQDPLAYNNRGMYLQSINRTKEALADFNKAIQLNPKFMPSYINRGFAYLEAGDAANAEVALTQALGVDPAQPGALSLRATARMNQNKTADALADYRKVTEIAPHNPMSHADLGFAHFFASDYASALSSFNKALQINKEARFLTPWKLACEIRTGQYQAASYAAIAAKPEKQRDWVDSLILFQIGKIDATTLLKSTHPENEKAKEAQLCEGYYFIGMELVRRNRSKEAVGYWQQAAQRKLPKLSAYRGAVFALQNNGATVR